MTRIRIEPTGPVNWTVDVPGSKSHTNRALICASLANGMSILEGASISDDSRILVDALVQTGIPVDGTKVHGLGGRIPAPGGEFFFGNAGTSLRFFTGLAALGEGRFAIDGDARMRERPIGGLVRALRDLGCEIAYGKREGFPPLLLDARGLRGGQTSITDDASSQFVSSVLLVAPYARDEVILQVDEGLPSWPYVELTLRVMRDFGVEVRREGMLFQIRPAAYRPHRCEIEPDPAAANYFHAAAAVTGGRVEVRGFRRGEGEARFVDILEAMGGRGIDVDMNDCPDSVQTLAVVALFAKGPTRIRNVRNLRVKETDRIRALATELRKLGARVTEFAEGLEIEPAPIRPAVIETYGDHRMAMSFAVAALAFPGIEIRDPECVSKSFPGFFEKLESLGVRIEKV